MVRRRSSITNSLPLTYYVPENTALSIISKHLIYLSNKSKQMAEMIKMNKGKYLDMAEREFLRSRCRVQNQIKVLKELEEELRSKSTECHRALSLVAERLQELDQKRAVISKAEVLLSLGISLVMSLGEALSFKSVLVHQMDVLERIFNEISLVQLPPTGANPGRDVGDYYLPPLLLHVRELRGLPEILELVKCEVSSDEECIRCCEPVRNLRFRPSLNENETREVINGVESEPPQHKQRYLCVNTGFEIFCLDLKQSKDQTFSIAQDVPFIPRIASLDLEEENLPTSAGLFKWRSNAYMIGGQKPSETLQEGISTPFKHACSTDEIKGTSCLTYGLSMAADDGTVSLSESNMCKLKKPKLWPIVEEINGQIHVIDCAPSQFWTKGGGWLFSHEVFDGDTGSWAEEIPTLSTEEIYVIHSYLVLGDHIYAAAVGASLVFDINKKKWEAYPKKRGPRQWRKNLCSFKEVWDILEYGPGKCVGRFPYSSDPLYVVIALQGPDDSECDAMYAVACLVTSTGQILCIQRLCDFFKGPVWPWTMHNGTVIQVDDEGKTLCSIVNGDTGEKGCGLDFLFINTFDVEMLSDAAPLVGELLAVGASEAWPIQQEFVRVDTKDTYLYKLDYELGWGLHSSCWAGLRACFL